ncbi:aminotransferase [Pedomonas mirosovicensis]|uniref:aminotransferase n=1 Tax=Pedomonas mirosovicensis TaxID=2908641 RepID=UPI0021671C27|nr:aminotransferase [Pedomonas mirosovicensis]MCH8686074.1 aminotransferase [Pedomonas mirosovicensis]
MNIIPNATFAALGTTVFTVMSALANEHNAVNLGQGFPDTDGPEDVRAVAARALMEASNQYPPMRGLPALRQAVARHEARFYGLEVDPDRGVLVTSGATEALTASIMAFVNPGDEVILIEPAYDSYLPIVRQAGATPRFLRLEPPRWRLEEDRLAALITPKTKLLILNTPHNPVGRVFSEEELEMVSRLTCHHGFLVVSDEVYEHIVFDGKRHRPLITFPGMGERTLKIASAGKTFSLTGWKVGMVTAAPALIDQVAKVHQFLTFTTPPNLQAAVAYGLGKEDAYFDGLIADMQAKRDRLSAGLAPLGFNVLPSEGTYFLTCDYAKLSSEDDVTFAKRLVVEVGVATIPLSPFVEGGWPHRLIRFCFAKQDAVLEEGLARLRRYFGT